MAPRNAEPLSDTTCKALVLNCIKINLAPEVLLCILVPVKKYHA